MDSISFSLTLIDIPHLYSNCILQQYFESFILKALLGCSFGCTLIDFKEITNTTMDKMSFSLTFRFLGCCIGAALGFGIPEKTNTTVLYSTLLTAYGTLSIIIAQLTELWSVFFVQFLMGLASGAIDVLVTAQIFQLWNDEGGSYMQAYVLSWNIAGVCSPLLFEPFLSPTKTNEREHLNSTNIHNDTLISTSLVKQTFNGTFDEHKNVVGANVSESRIWIPLSIIGMMLITSAKVKPFTMLLTLVTMIGVGNVIHVFFANTSLAMLWIGALIEFAGFGCFHATVFNYMQSKVGLTTKMCSVLVVWSFLAGGVGYTSLIGEYPLTHVST
ncbi:uncharacterized protein B4U80_14871 [Leptotrombidium deliense]|uniref:Sodium-dependent glucose transporter 1-like protein n=1 Tax=Leptotrombidium deliense TaxID=299467 RepID=A0A443S9B0_9ACAR|nr:uncharacterized protein B4U80_14871 [Leptotrombidium deliense]